MALYPETDSAIEDIVNEAIVSDTNDTPVQIELSNLNASDKIKNKVREEFRYILELLDFDKKCSDENDRLQGNIEASSVSGSGAIVQSCSERQYHGSWTVPGCHCCLIPADHRRPAPLRFV